MRVWRAFEREGVIADHAFGECLPIGVIGECADANESHRRESDRLGRCAVVIRTGAVGQPFAVAGRQEQFSPIGVEESGGDVVGKAGRSGGEAVAAPGPVEIEAGIAQARRVVQEG